MSLTKEEKEKIKSDFQKSKSDFSAGKSTTVKRAYSILSDKEVSEISNEWANRFNVDNNYVNAFVTDANKFLDELQKSYGNIDYKTATSGDYKNSMSQTEYDLNNRAWKIQNYLNTYKDKIDPEEYDSMTNFLSSFNTRQKFSNMFNDYYAQFKDADDYNFYKKYNGKSTTELDEISAALEDGKEKDWVTSYRGSVDYDEKSKYDLSAGAQEIAELEKAADVMATVSNEYFALTNTSQYFSEAEKTRIISQYNALVGRYGTPEELHNTINKKKQYLKQAKIIQEGIKLAGIADSSSELYDPEFSKYAVFSGSTKTDKWFSKDKTYKMNTGYSDIRHEYINDPDAVTDVLSSSASTEYNRLLGELKRYSYMTAEEKAIYNYYYNKQGYEAADKYLDSIVDSLNAQHGKEISSSLKNKPFLELVFSAAAGLDQFGSGIKNLFNFKDDYIPTSATQYASGLVREDLKDVDLKWYNFKEGEWDDAKIFGNSLGQTAYDLGTTAANMAPSILTSSLVGILNPAAGAVAGNALMGASAAGNAYADALNRGFGKAEARTYGVATGVSEALLQQVLGGIGKLGGASSKITKAVAGIDDALLRFSLQYGGKIASESLEEGLQEILDPIFQNAILGTDEDVNWSEVAYSALLGGLSAGTLELRGSIHETMVEQALKKKYDGKTDSLINQGLQNDVNSESYQLAQQYKAKTDADKTLTGAEISNLVKANAAQSNYNKAVENAKARFAQLGVTENVDELASIAAKRATGQSLTRAEKSTIVNSQFGTKVAKELRDANLAEYNGKPVSKPAEYKSLEDRVGTESSFEVSKDGQATDSKTGDAIDLSKAEVAEFVKDKDGKVVDMVIDVDGKQVKASEVDYEDGNQSYLFEAVSKIENITPRSATSIISDYDPSSGQTAGEYLNGVDEAFTYGYYSYSEADMNAGKFAPKLTETQRKSAYVLGQNERSKRDASKADNFKRMRTAAEAQAEKAAAEGKEAPKAKNLTVTYDRGNGNVVSIDKAGIRDAKRSGAVEVAKILHKLGLGTKVEFFSSYLSKTLKDEDGNAVRVFLDENGAERAAPSGVYRKGDGTIRVDLNAYNGRGLTLNALSHELTHFIQQWSEAKYKVLADFLIKAYEKTDMTMHERVLREQARLEGIRKESVSYDEAFDEVVANAMSKMLDDGKLVERLTELKAQDEKLARKLWQGFKKILAKFLGVYENAGPLFQDTADLMAMKETFEQLQNMFAEAMVEASENYQAALTVAESQTLAESSKEAGTQQSSQKTDLDKDFDYSDLNWATDLGIITAKDKAIFERTINNEIFRGAEPQSANGEYIIDTGKCLMFTDGDFHNPTLSRVIVFATEYESLTDEAKRRILYEAKSTGDVQVSQRIIENLYGPGFAVEYTPEVHGANAGQNGRGKRTNGKGSNQRYRAKSLKERLTEEGLSHLLEDDEAYSSQETDLDSTERKVNTAMTMAEAKRMIETAFRVNNIAEYYEDEYTDAEDWLRKAGADEVEMYIENDYDLQARYINSNEDILNEEYRMADVLEAYLAGTLIGKEKPKPKRLDVSQSAKIEDDRFYSPQKIEDAKATYKLAIQKAVGKDANAINRARAEILLFAHNKGAAELLGITQAELNKKLRSWSNYSATARDISRKINAGVAEENRWTGIENSSYINKAKITNEDIERLVASVEGDSKGYERKYIARVMLAADTHIDYSGLKFKFASSQQVNADNKGGNSGGNRVLGFYDDTNRLIEVTHDKPNTVAHEMGHYIDAQWGRDLIGTNSSHLFLTRGVNEDMVRARYGEPGVQFLKNFKLFINSLSDVNQNYNSYYNDRGEIFARFFARFIEWTDNIATGNKYYSYESTMYADKFTQAQFVEFARLLQEKALLDGTNTNVSEQYSSQETDADVYNTNGFKDYDIVSAVYTIRNEKAKRGHDLVEIGNMPTLYRNLFGLSGDVYVSNTHLYQNMVSRATAEKEGRFDPDASADYHELGEEKVINAIEQFQDPLVIMESLKNFSEPRLVAILDEKGNDGENLIAVLELYAPLRPHGVSQLRNHVLITIYEKNSLPDYIEETVDKNRILYKKEGSRLTSQAGLQLAGEMSKETLKKNVARFNKKVKAFKEENKIYYSTQETDYSNRDLLANAFEGLSQSSVEYKMIQDYKEQIKVLNLLDEQLSDLNAEIHEIRFTKGKYDAEKLRKLEEKAERIARDINKQDKVLIRMEASEPLRKIIEFERKKATQKTKEHIAEIQQNKKLRAEQAEYRYKIKKFKKKLEEKLLRPTDRQYVPVNLIKAMVEVCDIIDTDTDLYKPDGSINKAQAKRDETREKLLHLEDEYENLKNPSDPMYAGEFDEVVYDYLRELREKFKDKSLNEMPADELSEMYEILVSIDETIADARKLIGWGDAESVYEAGDSIVAEQNAITEKRKNGKRNAVQKGIDKVDNLGLSPVRNVERMSAYNQDSALLKLFKKFEQGIRKKNKFKMDAYKMFEKLTSGNEYTDAVYKEFGGKKYTDVKGRQFGVSKMQMMQAILSFEREQANKNLHHIEKGGFTFADLDLLNKGKLKEAISAENSHRVPAAIELVAEFQEILKDDKWCQDYMAAARDFFNGMAKNAVNETSIALKHRIIAKDKSYIPFEVDKNFVNTEITDMDAIQQTINSYGMLKDTTNNAPQALYITGLNNILDRHIDQVGTIYGLAVEVRNFNKVWNVRSQDESGNNPTVKEAIDTNWGKEGTANIEQAVKDIQGSRNRDRSALYDKIKSNYISSTFLFNLSVVTKQIGSLFSATSMLRWRDPIRMVGNLIYTMANYKKISAEVDKYTATAWMRRQGMSDAELHTLMTERKKTKLGRWLAKAPAIINPAKWITAMDHAVALSLWKYAKQDTAKKTGLKGDALLKATAEFYDEVVENTQSMTDVLHRPEIQKSGKVMHEAFAMFKTDLFQMSGQLQTTAGRFLADPSAENATVLGRTVYSVVMGALWGSLMTTLFALLRYKVDRYRDDEDEEKELTVESWLKRQGFGLAGDFAGYAFPILGSEAVGILERIKYGESDDFIDNISFTAINDLVDTMVMIATSIKEGEMPEPSKMRKYAAKALQVITPIPANNILRTLDAIQLHAEDIANGEFLSFNAGVDSKTDDLYDAMVKKDKSTHIKLKASYVDKEGKFDKAKYETAVSKGLQENDPRIHEAAQALIDGNKEEYQRIFKEIKNEGIFNYDEIRDAINSEENKIRKKTEPEKATSDYSAIGYVEAIAMGNATDAVAMKDDIIATKVANGKTQEEAEREFKTSLTTAVRDVYFTGLLDEARAKNMLVEYAGKDKDEAASKVNYWSFCEKHPEYADVLSESNVNDYQEFAEPANIPLDVFVQYVEGTKGLVSTKDEWGDVEVTKREQVLEVIDSLPLTWQQKDALYLAAGYSESKIWDVPW